MAPSLEALISAAEAPAPELPRLQAVQVFIKYGQLLTQAERMLEAIQALPKDTPQSFDSHCLDIAKAGETIAKFAMRLREANR